MKYLLLSLLLTCPILLTLQSCGDDDPIIEEPETEDPVITEGIATPVSAFDEFNEDAVTVSFDGGDIIIESNALPNHTSPYWDPSNSLYIDPVVANVDQMSPGTIREGSYTLTASATPTIADSPSATCLGAIGIAVIEQNASSFEKEALPATAIPNKNM